MQKYRVYVVSIVVQHSQRGEHKVRQWVKVDVPTIEQQSQLAEVGKVFCGVLHGCVGFHSIHVGSKFPDLEDLKASYEGAPFCTGYGEFPDGNVG